jgi:hypothetical protein
MRQHRVVAALERELPVQRCLASSRSAGCSCSPRSRSAAGQRRVHLKSSSCSSWKVPWVRRCMASACDMFPPARPGRGRRWRWCADTPSAGPGASADQGVRPLEALGADRDGPHGRGECDRRRISLRRGGRSSGSHGSVHRRRRSAPRRPRLSVYSTWALRGSQMQGLRAACRGGPQAQPRAR